jgi:hypothetical protein
MPGMGMGMGIHSRGQVVASGSSRGQAREGRGETTDSLGVGRQARPDPPPMDRDEFNRMQGQTLPGDALGVKLMHTKELLEAAGPQWLTEAFHAAGSLPKDNAVIAIRKMVRRPQSRRKLLAPFMA